jgi:hypothetical protein
MRGRYTPFILAAAFLLSGCGTAIDGDDCSDCGPCGFVGGPNQSDGLSQTGIGLDAGGRTVVQLGIWRQGQCAGAGGETFLLVWDGGQATLEATEAWQELDESTVTYDSDGSYTFTAHDLRVTSTRTPDTGFDFGFNDSGSGVATSLQCELDAEVDAELTCAAPPE